MSNNITGRAYTPEEKKEICDRLYTAWLNNSDLRLGQLVSNAADGDLFYLEDKALIERIEYE